MTSFYATQLYNPAFVLLLGLFAFAGLYALGTTLSGWLRFGLPAPWREVAALLLGIQTVSLAVQGLAMAAWASRDALAAIALALLAAGATRLYTLGRRTWRERCAYAGLQWSLPLFIAGCSVLTMLLVAVAPASKIDEVYYHMLLPSRILADGALRFYREPWEGAILPQMNFQISTTPLHAIGFPDAGNVVSWALAIALLWFGWHIIRARQASPAWISLWLATLCAGIYPLVFHVTSGAHAMGALSLAAATVAFALRDELVGTFGPVRYSGLMSLLAMSAGSTKVTLLPIVAGMLLLAVWPLLRAARGRARLQALLALAAPWLLFLFPIVLWTWLKSGAPFGPMLSDLFPASVYGPGWTVGLRLSRNEDYASALVDVFMLTSVGYSPLLFAGMLGAVACTILPRTVRFTLAVLLIFQTALILLLLIPDVRYYGGLHYGLLILFAACIAPDTRVIVSSQRSVRLASAAFLLPWLGVQIYYAQQFLPVSLGLQPGEAFYRRYVAFYEDYRALDRILPQDGVLFVDFRTSSVYAPRPVYFDPADLPAGRNLYVLTSEENAGAIAGEFPGFERGTVVYRNALAVTGTFRAPGQASLIQPIIVMHMTRP